MSLNVNASPFLKHKTLLCLFINIIKSYKYSLILLLTVLTIAIPSNETRADPPQTPKLWRPRLRSISEIFIENKSKDETLSTRTYKNGSIKITNIVPKGTCNDGCKIVVTVDDINECDFTTYIDKVRIKLYKLNDTLFITTYTFSASNDNYINIDTSYHFNNNKVTLDKILSCKSYNSAADELKKDTIN